MPIQLFTRCSRIVTDLFLYPRCRKSLLSWQRMQSGCVMYPIKPMCRASKGFQNWGSQTIWTKNSNGTVKYKHNVIKIWILVENNALFFKYISLFHTKKFPGFPYWKTFLTFFCNSMVELCPLITSCFWGPAHWW